MVVKRKSIKMIFFSGRGLNPGSYIFSCIIQPTELSSQGQK